MSRFSLAAVLVFVTVGAYAVDGTKPKTPVDKQKPVSPEGIEYLQKLRKNTPFGTKGFDLAALRAGMGSRREPTIKGVKLMRVKIGDIPCEWVLAPGADPDIRLLYIHGGGFVSGSGGFYLTLAAHLSAAAKCAVLLPDYRLAPEHRFPAGLEDCIQAHEWMTANGPAGPAACRATFVAGDSAGGSLTLATLLALRDRRKQLPAGGIALSPTTDLTLASESLKTVDDPIISAKTMPVFRDHYLGKTDPREPLASPVFGDYRGIPPLLVQVGEHEMLRDDSVRVAEKARTDGIQVKLEVWPGMFHVFQSHEPLLPEGKEAINHIAEFMRSSLPAGDQAKITHVFLATGGETYIVNGDGKVIWQYPHGSRDGWVLPNGNVLLALSKSKKYPGGAVVEVTRDKKVIFEFKGTQSEVNTVQAVEKDLYLFTEAGAKPRLLEVNREGKIVVEIPLQAQTKDHHLQTRMARKLANGNYLVPQLLDKVVREYSPKGDVVWEVKTPNMPFTAIRLGDGNTLIGCTLGDLVIEVNKDGKIVWQVTNDDLPGRPINDACGVQRLPNGNTVITSHHAAKNDVKLTEVTPDKKVVWTHRDSTKPGIHHFQILDVNGNAFEGRPLR